MVFVLVGMWAAANAGCGGTDTSQAPSGPCFGRAGATYVIDYVQRSGTCGAITEQVATPGAATDAQSACVGGATVSADQCTVTLDTACPLSGNTGGHDETRGTVRWSQDGATGDGVLDERIFDAAGALLCRSTYDVTYSRQ